MKRQQVISAFYMVAILSGIVSSAYAATTRHGVTITNETSTDSAAFNSFTLGYRFDALANSNVVRLGIWDFQGDGLSEAHDVGLWDATGTLLATTTVAAGTTDLLENGYRWGQLSSSVPLIAGQTYTVAAYYDATNDDLVAGNVVSATVDSRINVHGSVQLSGSSLAFPSTMLFPFSGSGGVFSYGGGNVMFASGVSAPACADGIDNDGDSYVDFPSDAGCADALDDNEELAVVTLQPGDIAIVQFRSDIDDAVGGGAGEEGFSFVALVDLPPYTQIVFTDEAWDGLALRFDSSLPTVGRKEHTWIWTYQGASSIPAGTVLSCQGSTCDNNAVIGGGNNNTITNLSGKKLGEQIIAYQGSVDDPRFLYAFSNAPFITLNQYFADKALGVNSINENTTILPPGLVNGVTAHDFDDINPIDNDNSVIVTLGSSVFNGGTREEILIAISDDSSWTRADSKTTPFENTLALTVSPSVAPRLSVASSTLPQLNTSLLVINYNDPTDPAAFTGIDFQIQPGIPQLGIPPTPLTVTATSLAPTIITPTDLNLQQTGNLWNLKIMPSNMGVTSIKVSVSDGTYFHDYYINVVVMPGGPVGARIHYGIADASAAIGVTGVNGELLMMVASDEHVGLDDGTRTYERTQPGRELSSLDFSIPTGLTWVPVFNPAPSELDLEGSLLDGNTSWWIGSSSNNKNGKCRPNRHGLYKVDPNAGNPILDGFRRDIRDWFYTWDTTNLHGRGVNRYGFTYSHNLCTTDVDLPGIPNLGSEWIAKRGDGFNIEGLARTPVDYDDYAPGGMVGVPTALVGFRAPIVVHQLSFASTSSQLRTRALLVPMTLETGFTDAGPPITFGEPIELDLGGRGVRSISRNEQGEYLIIAGSYGEHGEPLEADWIAAWAADFSSTPPPPPNDFKLYTWTGNDPDISLDPADMPVMQTVDLTTLRDGTGSFEGIVEVPALLAGSVVQLIVDDGVGIKIDQLLFQLLSDLADAAGENEIAMIFELLDRESKLSAPKFQRFRSYDVTVDPHRCFATGDDGETVYGSYDAQAIQNAMHNIDGSTIKIAGQCEGESIGVNSVGQKLELGVALKVYTYNVTLIGGFSYDPQNPDATDWDMPDPVANPTRIASGGTGFVINNLPGTTLDIQGINIDGPAGQLFEGTGTVIIEVWNINDNGAGSLRDAIADAPAGSSIRFAPGLSGGLPITLAGTQLTLDKDISISAQFSKGITISGNNASRVFSINTGVNVTLNGVTITGGNTSVNGAGIENNGGNLTLLNSTVHGNTSGRFGGGIMNDLGSVTITNSTFTDNIAAFGGAFFNSLTTATIRHSTIVNNEAVGLPGITTGQGGGIRNGGGTVYLSNSIVAENTATGVGPDIYNPSGSTMIPGGNNLIGNNAGTVLDFPDTDSLVGNSSIPLPPVLSPLGDNGGPTLTRIPLAGSPAINSAPSSSVVVDQRGILRPQGVGSDLGAVEIRLTVTSITDDASPGSLRQVIANAPAGSTITFDPSLSGGQPIILNGTQLTLDKDITIDASNITGGITISGNNNSRVIRILAGVNVTIKGVTITGGNVSGSPASHGAGIENIGGFLTLVDSTVSGNNASRFGGGIMNTDGTVTLINSTLANNIAGGRGGALYNDAATASMTLTNSTLTANTSVYGAAIFNNLGDTSLFYTTIAANNATLGAGGIYNGSGTVRMENSIIAANTDSGIAPDVWNFGTVVPVGANLIRDNTTVSGVLPEGSLVGTTLNPLEPILSPLANNGGPTNTMLPLYGSPVINAAVTPENSPPSNDQRGFARPQGYADDIGAVEVIVLVVENTNDNGPGSLRQVIADSPADGIVNFDESLSGTVITLSGTHLFLDKNTFIDASNLAAGLTISGNNTSRVFFVSTNVEVTLKNITISDGYINGHGGGIYNQGKLNLVNMTLTGNRADGAGGGIINFAGSTTLSPNGTVTITNSTLDNNSAGSGGGAIFSGTSASDTSSPAQATLINSTLTGNSSDSPAGAIGNIHGTVTLIHTTIVNNTSNDSESGSIFNDRGTMTVDNSIITANIFSATASDIFTVAGTTPVGVVTFSGANLLNPLDPELHVLGNYGGATMTMPPTSTSPAVDAALNAVYTMQIGDQLGNSRPQGNGSDIGAVELVDSDGDGLSDIDESINGTNPLSIDSDGDGLVDGAGGVVTLATYPSGIDLDYDGFIDGEQDLGTDPAVSNRGDVAPRGSPDSMINAGDLVVLSRIVLGITPPTTLEMILGDINFDGQVNVVDLLLLQQSVVNDTPP